MSSQNNNDAPPNSVPDRSALPLKPSEVLERAAALIEPEGAWTQFTLARNGRGAGVCFSDPEASCWCMEGAVARVVGNYFGEGYDAPARYLHRTLSATGAYWNDKGGRTQAEVVAALRQAAELARSEGQ